MRHGFSLRSGDEFGGDPTKFLKFFESAHAAVASSPLVPAKIRRWLFTNSGMVQFRTSFSAGNAALQARDHRHRVSSRGCSTTIRDVRLHARHHTFSKCRNFSFGDYFKRDAIRYAWDLLTKCTSCCGTLWTTVYHEDNEAYDSGRRNRPCERLHRIATNPRSRFQSDNTGMADTGPLRPCSEIFYDHGPGIPAVRRIERGRGRYRSSRSGTRLHAVQPGRQRVMTPAAQTLRGRAWGWRRIAAVLQACNSNYEMICSRI